MVRVNLIPVKQLADQHLVAEYYEILILAAYVRDYPCIKGVPTKYCLGSGHIKFFKNKLSYLKKRHEEIKKEMRKRGFKPNITLKISKFGKFHKTDWKPCEEDFKIIRKRILWKIKSKPNFYRYYGEKKPFGFFKKMVEL